MLRVRRSDHFGRELAKNQDNERKTERSRNACDFAVFRRDMRNDKRSDQAGRRNFSYIDAEEEDAQQALRIGRNPVYVARITVAGIFLALDTLPVYRDIGGFGGREKCRKND